MFRTCPRGPLRSLIAVLFSVASTTVMAGPPGRYYLPEVDANTIAVIDTASQQVIRRIPVGPLATRPAVLAITPDARKIYVDNFGALPATVSIIDRVRDRLDTLVVDSTPLGIFTSPDGREVFVPELGNVVEVIDTTTDKVVRKLHFSRTPVASIPGPDGGLYIGFADGFIGVYDPRSGTPVHAPIWSGGLAPFWFTFSKDHSKLYTDTVNSIGVIDLATWTLSKTIGTVQGQPHRLSDPGAFTSTLSPDGSKLYVTVFGDTGLRILDTATDTLIGSIPTDGSVTGVSFSADGTRGYISDLGASSAAWKTPLGELVLFGDLITVGLLGPGQLIEFDPRRDQILGRLPTRPGPGIGAWLPNLP